MSILISLLPGRRPNRDLSSWLPLVECEAVTEGAVLVDHTAYPTPPVSKVNLHEIVFAISVFMLPNLRPPSLYHILLTTLVLPPGTVSYWLDAFPLRMSQSQAD